jgi:hypothetical protein
MQLVDADVDDLVSALIRKYKSHGYDERPSLVMTAEMMRGWWDSPPPLPVDPLQRLLADRSNTR